MLLRDLVTQYFQIDNYLYCFQIVVALRDLVTQSRYLDSLVSNIPDVAFVTPEPVEHCPVPESNLCSPVYSAISFDWQLYLPYDI